MVLLDLEDQLYPPFPQGLLDQEDPGSHVALAGCHHQIQCPMAQEDQARQAPRADQEDLLCHCLKDQVSRVGLADQASPEHQERQVVQVDQVDLQGLAKRILECQRNQLSPFDQGDPRILESQGGLLYLVSR